MNYHHMSKTRLYTTWHNMKQRCSNPNFYNYELYGGRGISVCCEWANSFETFRDWAFSTGYSDDLTIDRIDCDGNYCPENCRWIAKQEQVFNRRNTIKTSDGIPVAVIAKEKGISVGLVHKRIKLGWDESDWFIPTFSKVHRKKQN